MSFEERMRELESAIKALMRRTESVKIEVEQIRLSLVMALGKTRAIRRSSQEAQ